MSDTFGGNASAAFRRAADRARQVLKPGDRVTLGSSCGGGRQTVTFAHFSDHRGMPDPDGSMFSSRSLDDLSPWNIVKVNGRAINFRDEAGQRAVASDNQLFSAMHVQKRRSAFKVITNPAAPELAQEEPAHDHD